METQAERNYHEQMTRLATEVFTDHTISKYGYRRWHIKKPGTYSYFAEVIATANGLYINGDIDVVVFAGGDHISGTDQVKWLGKSPASFDYVTEKAILGFSGRQSVYVYDDDVALDQLQEIRKIHKATAAIDTAISMLKENAYGRDEIIRVLYEDGETWSWVEDLDLGHVVAPRIYYAHAALQKLHALLVAGRGERWCLECGAGECACSREPRYSP